MKSATQEVLFQIVCTVIFVLASILMITEFVSAQSIVKQYGKQMGIHNELQLQDGDSEDWDQWDGQQWVHTQIKVKSQDILNEILSCDQDIFIYVSGNEIPHDVIENAKMEHDSTPLLAYIQNREYEKIYGYSENGKILSIYFQ